VKFVEKVKTFLDGKRERGRSQKRGSIKVEVVASHIPLYVV